MQKRTRISGLFISLTLLFIIISACKKDDENNTPPSIKLMEENTYVGRDTVFAAGAEIMFKVLLQKGGHDITNFFIDVTTDQGTQTYFDTAMNTPYLMWTGSFIKSFAQYENWEFTVRDREGNTASASLVIGLDTSSSYLPLDYIPSVTLGAQNNQVVRGCFNISEAAYFFFEEGTADTIIQAGIDLLYYYDPVDLNTLASPGANIDDGIFPVNPADWTITNTTRFIKTSLSADEFMEAANDSILLANYNESEAKRKAKLLQVNNVYTFRTQQGKLGMFLVNEVTGEAEGSINFHIKIQQ
ncbi:MAG TPA: hypothetical protein VK994_02170 [Bacteroidales bacterium]|nr:hypothetical protein [Bacteroidales bacterium]